MTWPLRRSRAFGEVDRQAGHPRQAQLRIVHLHHGAYPLCMLGVYPLRRRAHEPDRCPRLVAQLLPCGSSTGEEQLAQSSMQALVHLGGTVVHEIEQVRTPVGDAGGARKPGEMPGAGRIELDVAPVSTAVGSGTTAMDPGRRLQSACVHMSASVTNQGKH